MTYINNYPFVLIFFLLSFIFVFIAIIIKIKIIKKACIFLSSVFITLFIIELIFSFYTPPFSTKPEELYNKHYSFFPQKGNSYKVAEIVLDNYNRKWFLLNDNYDKNKNDFVKDNKIIIETIYTIDENGLRYTKSNNNSEEAYLFLGCSFIFGACVNDNETLPHLFSEYFNFEKKVVNAGQDARGINRAYSILANKDYLEKILNKSKLKYIFYEYMIDHVNRAFRYNMPSDVLLYENGKEYEVEQPFKSIKKIFTKCLIYERCFYGIIEKKSYPFYIKHINNTFFKMHNISKEYYDADFVVIMWDSNKEIEKYFMENDINFIKAYETLQYQNERVLYDMHPNVNGNKKITNLIIKYIKDKEQL